MIGIASDHTSILLKNDIKRLLDELSLPYKDFGTNETVSCHYPIYGARAARAVASGDCDRGILICGTGLGISLAANKIPGIRCAVCSEPYTALMSRLHNDTNMIAVGSRVVGTELAKMIIKTWLETPFEGGRHQARVDMITALDHRCDIE